MYDGSFHLPCEIEDLSANQINDLSCWCVRQAWKKLGTMPPEEAMEKYIDIVTELYPNWAAGAATVRSESLIQFLLLPNNTFASSHLDYCCCWLSYVLCNRRKEMKGAVKHIMQAPMDQWGLYLVASYMRRNQSLIRKYPEDYPLCCSPFLAGY